MNLQVMHPEKRRRMMRYARERKNFRLTKFSTYKLKLLSDHYQTTETAIVEAAIHLLSTVRCQEQVGSLWNRATMNEAVEVGNRTQSIADNLDV